MGSFGWRSRLWVCWWLWSLPLGLQAREPKVHLAPPWTLERICWPSKEHAPPPALSSTDLWQLTAPERKVLLWVGLAQLDDTSQQESLAYWLAWQRAYGSHGLQLVVVVANLNKTQIQQWCAQPLWQQWSAQEVAPMVGHDPYGIVSHRYGVKAPLTAWIIRADGSVVAVAQQLPQHDPMLYDKHLRRSLQLPRMVGLPPQVAALQDLPKSSSAQAIP